MVPDRLTATRRLFRQDSLAARQWHGSARLLGRPDPHRRISVGALVDVAPELDEVRAAEVIGSFSRPSSLLGCPFEHGLQAHWSRSPTERLGVDAPAAKQTYTADFGLRGMYHRCGDLVGVIRRWRLAEVLQTCSGRRLRPWQGYEGHWPTQTALLLFPRCRVPPGCLARVRGHSALSRHRQQLRDLAVAQPLSRQYRPRGLSATEGTAGTAKREAASRAGCSG